MKDDLKDKSIVGAPYKHQHSTSPTVKQIKIGQLFLVSAIVSENQIIPIFVVNDATFGITHFNKWKIDHGFADKLAKIEQLPFIVEVDIVEHDFKVIANKMKEKFKKEPTK